MMIKYPVHKLAKDFKKGGKVLPSKEVMDILAQYGHPPKNHMQPLTDLELSIVFEYLTQRNQIDSIEQVYADVYHEPESKKEPAPKAEGRQAQPKGEKKPAQGPKQQPAAAQEGARPAGQPIACLIISSVIYPGLKITGFSSVKSTIVDSRPISAAPPSIIISTLPSKSSATYFASVGLGRPERFALGAAM